MSPKGSRTAITVACLSSAVLFGAFLFVSVRIGQQISHGTVSNLVGIPALVLLGLICYVMLAAILASLLGAAIFDRFTTQHRDGCALLGSQICTKSKAAGKGVVNVVRSVTSNDFFQSHPHTQCLQPTPTGKS
ncbi:hypothetical protein E6O75_ATG03696 [Venturia nashicola]|uniref:Uncharacterized protein n=1 Tax=Venturia nashicola TaxID=86259 RepID=A0A4Z1P9D4_9PEZI|nr:hypothetical protein E6O75_ATG03696 [Venturia nashicola]